MIKKLVCLLHLTILITFNIHIFSYAISTVIPWPTTSVSDPKYRSTEDNNALQAFTDMQISKSSDGGLSLYFPQYEKLKTETADDKGNKIEYNINLVFQEEAIHKVSCNVLAENKGIITLSPAQLSALDMDHTIDGTVFGVVLSRNDPEGKIPKESGNGDYYNIEGDQFVIGNTYDNRSPDWKENSYGIGFYFKYDDPNKQNPVDPNVLTTPKPAKDGTTFNNGATSADISAFGGNTSFFGKNNFNQGDNNTTVNTDVGKQQEPKSGSTTIFGKGNNSSSRDTGTSPELNPDGGSVSIFSKGGGGAKPTGNGRETQINLEGTTSIFGKSTNSSSGKDTVAPEIKLDGGTSIFSKGGSVKLPVSNSGGGGSTASEGGDMPIEALFAAIASIVALIFAYKLFSR